MSRFSLTLLAGIALLAGLITYIFMNERPASWSRPAANSFETFTALPAPRPLPGFSLVDQSGASVGPDRFKGRWSVLFFGFTHCPDICPTTLYELARMKKSLADIPPQQQPSVYLVSVDVSRDTPEVMANYVRAFDASFTGITGKPEELDKLAASLGVAYGKEMREDGSYEVLHTAALFFLNDEGDFVAVSSAPHDPATLARDYRKLLARAGA